MIERPSTFAQIVAAPDAGIEIALALRTAEETLCPHASMDAMAAEKCEPSVFGS